LEIADVMKDIESLPLGINTIIGERGITLSGGQKQRIALARSIIRKPKILFLDDTLSAVDNETESRILKNLSNYIIDLTTIIVSHKISAVMNCNKIIVLENGRIIESGNHEELLKKKGFYYNMFSIQKLGGVYGSEVYTS
jgi:ATP-binding cassette subfamily B protein